MSAPVNLLPEVASAVRFRDGLILGGKVCVLHRRGLAASGTIRRCGGCRLHWV